MQALEAHMEEIWYAKAKKARWATEVEVDQKVAEGWRITEAKAVAETEARWKVAAEAEAKWKVAADVEAEARQWAEEAEAQYEMLQSIEGSSKHKGLAEGEKVTCNCCEMQGFACQVSHCSSFLLALLK